ncbi:hypothetical protein TrVFT333_007601 [Trichoderma virens FT-333]|nr:hypothetical protein TrVFT333_007601 [Trichoderma virens FT-333]
MAGIAEASPYMDCGPDFANAGHTSLPFPPADREGTSTTIWPNLCHSSTGLEHSNVFLPTLPWQNAEWDISQGFLKYPDPSSNSPPAESVTSGSESSLGAGMIWDYQNDQLPQGREYSPSTTASSTSDHLTTIKPSSLHSFNEPSTCKKPKKTRKSSVEEEASQKGLAGPNHLKNKQQAARAFGRRIASRQTSAVADNESRSKS